MSTRRKLIRRRDLIEDEEDDADLGLQPHEVPVRFQQEIDRQPIFIDDEEDKPKENPGWDSSSEDSLSDIDDIIDDDSETPMVSKAELEIAIYHAALPRRENKILVNDDFIRYQTGRQKVTTERVRTTPNRKAKTQIPMAKNPFVAQGGEREGESSDEGDAESERDYDIQPDYMDEPEVVDRDPKGIIVYDSDYDPEADSDQGDEEDSSGPELIPTEFYDVEKCKENERILYDYQLLPANLIKSGSNKSMMLIYGTGSGKTLAAFTLINAMMKRETVDKAKKLPTEWIIVLPPGLEEQWKFELREDQICNVFHDDLQELRFLNRFRHRIKIKKPQEFVAAFLKDGKGMNEVKNSYVLVDEIQNYRYSSTISTLNYEKKAPSKKKPKTMKKLQEIIDLTREPKLTREEAQKLPFVGAVSHAKSCFFITATPITGNISDMASYLWMMQKRQATPTKEQLDEIARLIVKNYKLAIAPPKEAFSNVKLTKYEKESAEARRHLQETPMREMWKCFFLFNEARQSDGSTPIATTHWEYCRFEETEEEKHAEARKSNNDNFRHRSTAASNSDSKMMRMVKIVTEKLRDPNARIVIVSRNISKSEYGIARIIPFLENPGSGLAPISYMDITSSSDKLKEVQIKAFNTRQRQPDPRRKQKKGGKVELFIEPERVLLIGPSSSEGTDFKGITCVILMEPSWREPTTEQIIGRAVRKNAHRSIPTDSKLYNKVDVYRMISLRPLFPKKLLVPIDPESNPKWLEELANRLKVEAGLNDPNARYLDSSILNQAVLEMDRGLEDSEDLMEMENNTGNDDNYLDIFTTDQLVLTDGYVKWQEASAFLQILRRIQVEKDCVSNKLTQLFSDPVKAGSDTSFIKLEKKSKLK